MAGLSLQVLAVNNNLHMLTIFHKKIHPRTPHLMRMADGSSSHAQSFAHRKEENTDHGINPMAENAVAVVPPLFSCRA
jgi:hypothetical protein